MRSKLTLVLLFLALLCIYNPTYSLNAFNSSFSGSAHLEKSEQDNVGQRNLVNFGSTEFDLTHQMKQGHGVGGHGGHGGSHGGFTGGSGGSSSSGGQGGAIIPENAGGTAQNLRNTHHNGGSSYKKYAGCLTMVAIFLGALNIQHNQ